MSRPDATDRSEGSSRAAPRELSRPARAKVNLRLRVFERDESGYHSLESLYLRASWYDTVTVTRAGSRIELEVEGPEPVPEGPENLCWRAAEAFFRAVDRRPAARIRLQKRIPCGTGLGGASADAAVVLRLLNELHGLPLEDVALLKLGGQIGSDVPFAVLAVPMALGWERGRRLLPLRPPPSNPALLVVPPERVRSSDAYVWLARARATTGIREADPGALPGSARLSDWRALQRIARNDFESVVFERYPELGHVRERIEETGALIARLTGSGSALFAVYPDVGARNTAVDRLALPGGWTVEPGTIPG